MARKPKIVRTEAQYQALTARQRETYHRGLAAISDFRNGDEKSLEAAARRNHTTPKTVKKYAKSALRKTPSGRYQVTKQDSFFRRMVLPTPDGPREFAFSGPGASRKASLAGKYYNAMMRALRSAGDDASLLKLRSRSGDQLSALGLEADEELLADAADSGLFDDLDSPYQLERT